MISFKEHYNNKQLTIEEQLFALYVLADESFENLNESTENIADKIKNKAKKIGMSFEKSKGLLDYIKQFSFGIGKIFLMIIKGDLEGAKAVIKSDFTIEDFLDFLYNLDQITLNLVTGPLGIIDGLTGWNLQTVARDQMKKAVTVTKRLRDTIIKLKNSMKTDGDERLLSRIEALLLDDNDRVRHIFYSRKPKAVARLNRAVDSLDISDLNK